VIDVKEKDKDDNEEYKKRIKDVIKNVDKNNDLDILEDEQQFFEEGEKIKQKIITKIHPDYCNENIIRTLVFMIHGYYKRREVIAVQYDEKQYQDKIDELYGFIYEELKKPSPNFPDANLNRKNNEDIIDKRRIFWQIFSTLGQESVEKDFVQKTNVVELLKLSVNFTKIIFIPVFVFAIIIIIVLLSAFYRFNN